MDATIIEELAKKAAGSMFERASDLVKSMIKSQRERAALEECIAEALSEALRSETADDPLLDGEVVAQTEQSLRYLLSRESVGMAFVTAALSGAGDADALTKALIDVGADVGPLSFDWKRFLDRYLAVLVNRLANF